MRAENDSDRHRSAPRSHFSLWEAFAFLIVVAAIGAGCLYLKIRSKRDELVTRQMDLKDVRGRVEEARKRVELQRGDVRGLQAQVTRLESLEKEKSAIEAANIQAGKDLASWRAQLTTAVREQRAKAAGTLHPELRLVDGEVLTGVRIISVSDSEISLAHSGGVARVPAQKLPVHFQERFRFGSDMPDETRTSSSSNESAPVPSPVSSRLTESQRRRVATLNTNLVAKKSRLLALEQMVARDRETDRPTSPEALRPAGPLPKDLRIQQEREMQRKAVELNVKNAAVTARDREISALQKDIAAIRTELELLYQTAQ